MFSDHFGNPFEYEPAPLMARGFAYMLDNIILVLFWIMVILLVIYIASRVPGEPVSGAFSMAAEKIGSVPVLNKIAEILATVFIVVIIFLVYFLMFLPVALAEFLLGGRSPGKFLFGLRTMSSNGEYPGFGQVVVRTLIRGVEVNSLIALIFIIATPRRQTFYDVLAGTVVIKDFRLKAALRAEPAVYPRGKALFRLPVRNFHDVLLWQRYFLMLFISEQPSPAVREFHCQLALNRLLGAAPSVKPHFRITGRGGDGLANEEMLWNFARALDRGEVVWENR